MKLGKLHRRVEGDLTVVHHRKQFGNQVGQADISFNLIAAFAGIVSNLFYAEQLLPNLGRSDNLSKF